MTFHGIPRRMCRDVVFMTQCNFPIVVLSVGFCRGRWRQVVLAVDTSSWGFSNRDGLVRAVGRKHSGLHFFMWCFAWIDHESALFLCEQWWNLCHLCYFCVSVCGSWHNLQGWCVLLACFLSLACCSIYFCTTINSPVTRYTRPCG